MNIDIEGKGLICWVFPLVKTRVQYVYVCYFLVTSYLHVLHIMYLALERDGVHASNCCQGCEATRQKCRKQYGAFRRRTLRSTFRQILLWHIRNKLAESWIAESERESSVDVPVWVTFSCSCLTGSRNLYIIVYDLQLSWKPLPPKRNMCRKLQSRACNHGRHTGIVYRANHHGSASSLIFMFGLSLLRLGLHGSEMCSWICRWVLQPGSASTAINHARNCGMVQKQDSQLFSATTSLWQRTLSKANLTPQHHS